MDNQDIKKIAQWMVEEGYFIIHKGRYVVSERFNREVLGKKEGLKKLPNGRVGVVEANRPAPAMTTEDWRDLYMKFIIECKVPKYVSNGNGGVYEANKYSEPAMKQFRTMITEENVDVEKLKKVTREYYSNVHAMRKTISNYILEGLWRTEYFSSPSDKKEGGRYGIG